MGTIVDNTDNVASDLAVRIYDFHPKLAILCVFSARAKSYKLCTARKELGGTIKNETQSKVYGRTAEEGHTQHEPAA